MFGLRGFLLRRDTLLRQSSLEGLARLRPSSLASAKDAIRGSPVPPPPVPPPRPPRPPSAPSAPALPVPPPHLETSLTTTTHVAPTARVREEVPSANALPAAQDPSGLRSCKKRSCLGRRRNWVRLGSVSPVSNGSWEWLQYEIGQEYEIYVWAIQGITRNVGPREFLFFQNFGTFQVKYAKLKRDKISRIVYLRMKRIAFV